MAIVIMSLSILGNIRGYEKIWFIGDEFMMSSFTQHFQHAFDAEDSDFSNMGYIKSHCDVVCKGSRAIWPLKNENLIGKIRNALVEAINEYTLLPKSILIVLDDDLIIAANHYTDGISHLLGSLVDWIATEMHRIIAAHKDKLPTKARKFRYPQILWTAAMHHVSFTPKQNKLRKKLNSSLYKVADMYREMSVLMLHSWDSQNRSYVNFNGALTAEGLHKYWLAVDDAYQKYDREQLNVMHKAKNLSVAFNKQKIAKDGNGKCHWKKPHKTQK